MTEITQNNKHKRAKEKALRTHTHMQIFLKDTKPEAKTQTERTGKVFKRCANKTL